MLAMLYALNIVENKRTYAQCPRVLKPDVAEQLRVMGYENLITE